ncbi:GIN domain-containing protein [Pedobacter sp. 22226]|uniref:GIN domain-containing protein n=1 Tax=Pedobacter sp. 22226 TaxID=3453894 RepID=UPI003F868216
MKNSIKNLFAAVLVMVTLSSATVVANATENNANYTAITKVKNISKIVVSGNVKLILVQDAKESVEVYDQYYTKNALVQQQGAELRISSFDKNALTVIAHVNNLTDIEASNTATVSTAGTFNLLNLNVVLNDEASADIKANTVNLSTNVKDDASLKLEGTTDSHQAVLGIASKINMAGFTAQETSIRLTGKSLLANNKSRYDDIRVDLLEKLF